jgi:hypothetical protein
MRLRSKSSERYLIFRRHNDPYAYGHLTLSIRTIAAYIIICSFCFSYQSSVCPSLADRHKALQSLLAV